MFELLVPILAAVVFIGAAYIARAARGPRRAWALVPLLIGGAGMVDPHTIARLIAWGLALGVAATLFRRVQFDALPFDASPFDERPFDERPFDERRSDEPAQRVARATTTGLGNQIATGGYGPRVSLIVLLLLLPARGAHLVFLGEVWTGLIDIAIGLSALVMSAPAVFGRSRRARADLAGVPCPACGSAQTDAVLETQLDGREVRVPRCFACDHRWAPEP